MSWFLDGDDAYEWRVPFYVLLGLFFAFIGSCLCWRYFAERYCRLVDSCDVPGCQGGFWHRRHHHEDGERRPRGLGESLRRRRIRNNLFSSFLRQQPEPRLIFNFPPEARVGETVTFKILFPRNYLSYSSEGEDQNTDRNNVTVNQLSEHLNIEVTKLVGTPERIPIIMEIELGSVDSGSSDMILLVQFSVREAGFYEINVRHKDSHMRHSPCLQVFVAGPLDPDKTELLRGSPTILFVTNVQSVLIIEPKDRFGNLCRIEDVHPHKFSVIFNHIGDNSKQEPLETVIYNFRHSAQDDWGQLKTLVKLETEIFVPGMFQGTVIYEGRVIGNGAFDIVSLTEEENKRLQGLLKDSVIYHEAKLLSLNAEVRKPRTVFLYVAPKLLVVKDYFLGLIPTKVAVYRILPATKIKLLHESSENSSTTFTIHDRVQPTLTLSMATEDFRIFMAMFVQFLHQRLGGSESFESKQKFFYEEVVAARAKEERNREFIAIRVDRKNVLETTLNETKNFGPRDWCKKFKIEFISEAGSDDGGLRREWSELCCKTMFEDNPNGMFCSFGNSRLVHPNHNRDATWTLKHYELGGKIVGKCLFETAVGGHYKQMVNGRFSRSFLGQIIGYPPTHKYFEQDEPELHLGKVKYILENDVSSMDLTFSEEEYNDTGALIKTVELIPNGSKVPVTSENKEAYLNSLATYRLGTRVKKEIESFLKGLNDIIPDGLLTNFDENELEILMCGRSTFSVEDLKRHHVVSETDGDIDKILSWFWTTVDCMSDEEKTRLLQFTTGSSLLPHGGFSGLQPTFRITLYSTNGKLPVAHTCFNEICLSNHKTYESFARALRTAVNECSEGFAFM